MGFMGFGGGLIGLVVIVAIVWVVLQANRRGGEGGQPSPDRLGGSAASTSAEEILRQRYARGEIDHDEYRRRLEDLRQR